MTRSTKGFQYGELILAIKASTKACTTKNSAETRRLFQLIPGGSFNDYKNTTRRKGSHGHAISHDYLRERESVYVQRHGFTFRRPSLDEYVLLMDRVPAPTYPKDAHTMVAHLDVGEGSRVLEAGAGSGGLTLHLSKNVGRSGQVYSFESTSRHMAAARTNFKRWCTNWELVHGGGGGDEGREAWPDNVVFVEDDVSNAANHITSEVDAVALDLMSPGPLLTKLLPILKPSCLLSVYLPNITQHIELLEHIRTHDLPLELERLVEVLQVEWTVKLAASKHQRLANMAEEEGEPKYICRPSHKQQPHTAFLSLLRKVPPGCQPQ